MQTREKWGNKTRWLKQLEYEKKGNRIVKKSRTGINRVEGEE